MRAIKDVRASAVLVMALFGALVANGHAEMASIDDDALSNVTGQSGVYLSGDITINEAGGTISNGYFGACGEVDKVCGGRLSFQTQQNGGWFVLDDIRGSIAFDGLTFQVRNVSSGFGGDGALFNRDVIEIGMPETLKLDQFQYTIATSSTERPDELGFKQVELFGVEMSGEVQLEGKLLVFPTD